MHVGPPPAPRRASTADRMLIAVPTSAATPTSERWRLGFRDQRGGLDGNLEETLQTGRSPARVLARCLYRRGGHLGWSNNCRFVGPTGRQLFDDAVRLLRCEVGSSFAEPSVSSSCGGHQRGTARVIPRVPTVEPSGSDHRGIRVPPSGHGDDDRPMVEMSRVLLVALVASSLADIVRPRIPLVLGAKSDGPRGGDRLSMHQLSVINRFTEAKLS